MKVRFLPQDIEVEIEPNETVLQVAQKNGIFIKSVCNGVPSCAECRVNIVEGEYNVLQPSQKELQLIGTAHFIDQRRLSCQMHTFGDITVDLSEQIEKEKNEGTKRRMKLGVTKDAEASQAKAGNLMDQDKALLKEVESEVGDRIVEEPGSQPLKKSDHSFKSEDSRSSRKANSGSNHKRHQRRGDSQRSEGRNEGEGGRSNKNRRRNKNNRRRGSGKPKNPQ